MHELKCKAEPKYKTYEELVIKQESGAGWLWYIAGL